MLDFIKKHGTKIVIVLLLITFFRSCSKNSEIRKLSKTNIELTKESQSKDSLLVVYKNKIDSFPERLRQNSLLIHQEYDLWISKRDRGPQLMELHNDFVKPKIQDLSK
jgi:PBP1b-binding outer membrane lipoprotein LpoB